MRAQRERQGFEMSVAAEVVKQGFLFVPSYMPGSSALEAMNSLGIVARLQGMEPVQVLTPHALETASPNTYSGNFGLGQFAFHTDMAHWALPPRYLVLRCVCGFASVPTLLIDGLTVIEKVSYSELRRALVKPRRPIAGSRPLLPLLQKSGAATLLRWDEIFIQPATGNSRRTYEKFRGALSLEGVTPVALLDPGDTLIIDNWRMLHGREAVPSSAISRRLERAYFTELK